VTVVRARRTKKGAPGTASAPYLPDHSGSQDLTVPIHRPPLRIRGIRRSRRDYNRQGRQPTPWQQAVLDQLGDQPLSLHNLAQRFDRSKASVDAALYALWTKGCAERVGRGEWRRTRLKGQA
jgi:predicted Rossmann fold nucleotide-binding protein DprA/Smf involved in DNA uptake